MHDATDTVVQIGSFERRLFGVLLARPQKFRKNRRP